MALDQTVPQDIDDMKQYFARPHNDYAENLGNHTSISWLFAPLMSVILTLTKIARINVVANGSLDSVISKPTTSTTKKGIKAIYLEAPSRAKSKLFKASNLAREKETSSGYHQHLMPSKKPFPS
jgi:hypothetical protein